MNAFKILLTSLFLCVVNAVAGSFKDPRDGKSYKTVKIGTQIWMAQNLNYKAVGSVCNLDGKSNTQCENGRFYPYDVAMRACPTGWHLPSKEDLLLLQDLAFANSKEPSCNRIGTLLKSKTGWKHHEGVADGTDYYGFNSYPAGAILGTTEIILMGETSDYWSSSTKLDNPKHAVTWGFHWERESFGIWESDKELCYHTIRCLKD